MRTATRPFFTASAHPSITFAFNVPYTFTASYTTLNHTASLFGISSYTRGQLPSPIHSLERRLHRDSSYPFHLSLSTSLQPPERSTMPIHRVKFLIPCQGPRKNTNHYNSGVAQRRSTHTVYGSVSSSTLLENVRDGEPLFAKKSVRSIDHLRKGTRKRSQSSKSGLQMLPLTSPGCGTQTRIDHKPEIQGARARCSATASPRALLRRAHGGYVPIPGRPHHLDRAMT